jgi:F-type H+-transporting ATPase subunit b
MIDWFTTIAQIVNFLILVGLLKYFLYGRIMAAMDERQQEIAARWDEAHQQRDEAKQELSTARGKNLQLDDQRGQMLAKVRDDVELHRQQLTAKVRGEVDELQERWSDAIQEETESFLRELRRRASEEVCAIARRALADLAGENLESQIVQHFLHKVGRLGDDERQAVTASFQQGNRVAVVQTSHELGKDLQQAITNTLQERFVEDLDIHFEQSTDLLCGIALQTNAHKLAWNLRDYFDSLEQELKRTLEEEAATRKPRPKESADRGQ